MPWKLHRSAITGEFVTAAEARQNPDTTVAEVMDPAVHTSDDIAAYAVHEDDAARGGVLPAGGWSIVGEQGPELVDLPPGTSVEWPHDGEPV